MTQTKETWYKSTLAKLLEPADTTMDVATAPTVTKGRLYLTNWQQEERIGFSWVSGTTLQNLTRWLSKTADPATSWTWLTWIAWTVVKLVIMHDQLVDKLEGDQIIMEAKVYATTAARDTALWGDWVATKAYTGIYVTATGLHYNYNLSTNQWESVDTGTTTPNSSETVAWIKEDATQAEFNAGTKVGWTGANLSVTPDVIQAWIQSGSALYAWASAAGTDTYAVTMTPTLTAYTTWMKISFKADVANTGACTINVDSLWAKSIKTLDWNDPQDWAIRANQLVELVYDGTNMVMQHEDLANTWWKWTVEKSTDAEAKAWTTEKYPDSDQMAKYWVLTNTVEKTLTFNAANGWWTTTIAHWLWRIPKWFIVLWEVITNVAYWQGSYDIDTTTFTQKVWNWKTWAFVNFIAWYWVSASYSAWWAITAVDATNITLTYTNTTWWYGTFDAETVRTIIA